MEKFLTRKPKDKDISTAVRGGIEQMHEFNKSSERRIEQFLVYNSSIE